PRWAIVAADILHTLKAATLALLLAGAADAQQRSHPPAGLGCTAANFQGTYGNSGSGTILEGPNAGPVAFVGQLTADGKGTFAGRNTVEGQVLTFQLKKQ